MNEQEMIINEKIKKREKIDIVLAYILIIILLGSIILVLYLKFVRKTDEVVTPEEYTPTYISLNELSNLFNTSTLVANYTGNNANLSSSVMDNKLNVNYLKDESYISLDIELVNNELIVDYNDENKEVIEDIYIEIATIVCVYNGNVETDCRNTINSINNNNQIDGIRFAKNENNTTVSIDIMKKIDIIDKTIYNNVTSLELSNTDYILMLENTEINNINVINDGSNVVFTGSVKSLNQDKVLSILVKIYGIDGELLDEKKYEYTDENPLNGTSEFKISFELNDKIKLEDVNKYSIEVIK